ncbi:hypothetical protein [Streptomyces sp. MMBL 11-1]|uniref:hypothetical protein n=1 Tax=Streptomyces sp. MMBL 11-1 TaxID=3026420 RepID=UPI00235E87EB|nr:hypothetical protein [Streptomyces sp. MMBL 11-1]
MSDVWSLRRSPEGTRREHRRQEELQLRLRGEYGPEWWEVLPAFAGLAVVVGLPLSLLGWLWVRAGWWAALLGAAALAYAVRAAVLRRRAALARKRRRAVCFTLDQVDAADDRGFRRIVGRLLVRDGWVDVRGVRVNDAGVVHLVGKRPSGRRLGVAFERGVENAGQDGPRSAAALRSVSAAPEAEAEESTAGDPPALLLVVSSGSFARERVLWAARTDVRLVDRATLQRWAAGEDLAVLLDLGTDDVLPNSA